MASGQVEFSYFNLEYKHNSFIHGNLPAVIIISYILFCKVIGPRMMKHRKPMDLKLLIFLYNVLLCVTNAILGYRATTDAIQLWRYHCDFSKSPVYTNREKYLGLGWFYLIVKYVELLDTVFFVLRKKFNQVSFLHVFHHGIMCSMVTLLLKYNFYGWYQVLVGSVNSFIHVILYLYYTLSALGPSVKKYLWWKKYVTTLQIMQFFLYLAYMTYSYVYGCGFGKMGGFDVIAFLLTLSITALFLNFYFKTYR